VGVVVCVWGGGGGGGGGEVEGAYLRTSEHEFRALECGISVSKTAAMVVSKTFEPHVTFGPTLCKWLTW